MGLVSRIPGLVAAVEVHEGHSLARLAVAAFDAQADVAESTKLRKQEPML
jgi:hypothetical protein